ncbi:MAG: DUF167 domain-containing protein [Planctomycetales bacterium]|nr:DUF167 domain-containing protein [Planctomycetales bacterium]
MSELLRQTDEGVLLAVHAHPGARANELRGVRDERLRVAVTAAPEKGKANKAIAKLLAKQLGLRPRQLSLVSGDTSPQKVFLIVEVELDELTAKLAALRRAADER